MKQVNQPRILGIPVAWSLVVLLLFLVSMVPYAAADNSEIPLKPLIVRGNAIVNGDPADTGMEVMATVNDKVVGTTIVTTPGVYGDLPTNRLLVTCEPEDYDQIKLCLDGVECELSGDNLENARPGDSINLDISSTSNYQQVIVTNYSHLLLLFGGILAIVTILVMRSRSK